MSESRLQEMADTFEERITPFLGSVARINKTFYSYNVVSRAITRLRLDAIKGKEINENGRQFLGQAAAYLARLSLSNWQRKNLSTDVQVEWGNTWDDSSIVVSASRHRVGGEELYTQDYWKGIQLCLNPPGYFPYSGQFLYSFESIVLPTPEALYLYGDVLMQSPHATGNWPRGPKPGGLEEDFEESKQILIDDLHTDCGLPLDDPGMRQLSYWVVFPPYGWTQNDNGNYNLMTIFSQISEKQVLPRDRAFEYLRGLLRSQCLGTRNLAARALMVYDQAPQNIFEARAYDQAMKWRDFPDIERYLLGTRAQLEGDEKKISNAVWVAQVKEQWSEWGELAYSEMYDQKDPVQQDPRYHAVSQIAQEAVDEAIQALAELRDAYPESWLAKMLHTTVQLRGGDPSAAEQQVREVIESKCPNPEAHLRLGTHLKYSGRRKEALSIFQDAVKQWPYHYQTVDSCLWLITDDMVSQA